MRRTLIVLIVIFIAFGSAYSQTQPNREFNMFLTKLDAAQLELQSGRAEAFKSLWSQSDDITLSGGFGGTVEKGWAAISKRLDWVGANFLDGTNSSERIVTNQEARFGYVVQLEHVKFVAAETGRDATRDYRVTMIFRRERNGWRIVHRQADSNLTKQAPR